MNTAAAALATPAAPAATPEQGTQLAPPPTAPASSAPASGQPAANSEWYSGLGDETMIGWVQNKGWKDPLDAVRSGYNLEKLVGFEKAGRTIVLPKDDATPEEMRAFYTKMGVPDKADGYKLPVPEGQSGEFAQTASNWFHEIGIPPKQAEMLASKWNEHMAGAGQAQEAAFAQQSEAELSSWRTEQGAAADQNIELARRAMTQFLPAKDANDRADMLGKMERAIGTSNMMKMFASMGKGLGEHSVHQGEGGDLNVLTPAQAKQRIEALKQDKAWTAKYLNGDATAKAEMERLSKLAVGQAA